MRYPAIFVLVLGGMALLAWWASGRRIPLATEAWVPKDPGGPLTPEEKSRAAQLKVWPVWWQLPDKDWEALCLCADDAERLFAARQDDLLLKTWGRVGKREPQALLAWLEANARAASGAGLEDGHRAARELLRRSETTEKEPLTLRTW